MKLQNKKNNKGNQIRFQKKINITAMMYKFKAWILQTIRQVQKITLTNKLKLLISQLYQKIINIQNQKMIP